MNNYLSVPVKDFIGSINLIDPFFNSLNPNME